MKRKMRHAKNKIKNNKKKKKTDEKTRPNMECERGQKTRRHFVSETFLQRQTDLRPPPNTHQFVHKQIWEIDGNGIELCHVSRTQLSSLSPSLEQGYECDVCCTRVAVYVAMQFLLGGWKGGSKLWAMTVFKTHSTSCRPWRPNGWGGS